mmetsp:Transcript_5560/g.34443  ORF Transcript_5560/g.34443 Transcript_5560/m.34443 type:complete len:244 (-) Transcript_5560:241-972(-)
MYRFNWFLSVGCQSTWKAIFAASFTPTPNACRPVRVFGYSRDGRRLCRFHCFSSSCGVCPTSSIFLASSIWAWCIPVTRGSIVQGSVQCFYDQSLLRCNAFYFILFLWQDVPSVLRPLVGTPARVGYPIVTCCLSFFFSSVSRFILTSHHWTFAFFLFGSRMFGSAARPVVHVHGLPVVFQRVCPHAGVRCESHGLSIPFALLLAASWRVLGLHCASFASSHPRHVRNVSSALASSRRHVART